MVSIARPARQKSEENQRKKLKKFNLSRPVGAVLWMVPGRVSLRFVRVLFKNEKYFDANLEFESDHRL